MFKKLLFLLTSLLIISCSEDSIFDENIWLETQSSTVYTSSMKEKFTGEIRGKEGLNTFYGELKDGKPHGECYWLNENSDTIQILRFKEGQKIFSRQFSNKHNKVLIDWSMEILEPNEADQKYISLLLEMMFTDRIDSIANLFRSAGDPPDLYYLNKQITSIRTEYGEIENWTISDISKVKYSHRDEHYIEAKLNLKTSKQELKYKIRLLSHNARLSSLNLWEQENEPVNQEFIKPDFYFFLKL